jgi:hypothetical protein
MAFALLANSARSSRAFTTGYQALAATAITPLITITKNKIQLGGCILSSPHAPRPSPPRSPLLRPRPVASQPRLHLHLLTLLDPLALFEQPPPTHISRIRSSSTGGMFTRNRLASSAALTRLSSPSPKRLVIDRQSKCESKHRLLARLLRFLRFRAGHGRVWRPSQGLSSRLEKIVQAKNIPFKRYITRCLERCAAEDGHPIASV